MMRTEIDFKDNKQRFKDSMHNADRRRRKAASAAAVTNISLIRQGEHGGMIQEIIERNNRLQNRFQIIGGGESEAALFTDRVDVKS